MTDPIERADEIAKQVGFLIGISGELYMLDLTPNTAIFVEKVDELYDCYRLKWGTSVEGKRQIISEKYYMRGKGIYEAFGKGKSIIDWYAKIGKSKG